MSQKFDHINDDLLVKYLLGEATAEERLQVEAWMASDVAHKKQYEDFKTIWEESKQLALVSTVDENAAWQRFKERVQQPKEKAVVRKMRSAAWLRIAALFIVIAGAGYFSYKLLSEKPIENIVVASNKVPLVDTLPDGSVVTLNKNSQLDYPSKFKGETRTISLKGEAFFNVKPNKEKPFIIHVNDVTVRVVGTSFNIKSVNGVIEVIVETGVVQVIRNNKMVELRPHEKARVTQQDSVLTKEKEQDELYTYYRSKEFVCDGTPLWKLVQALNEAYDAHIEIENSKLRSLPLTVTFNNESLDQILDVIGKTFDITVIKEKDRIILR
ncbi:MAG TPA: FecR domain-containing protein [Flavisolibacter sp.]|nr:FecR domain-containing protein [Flavisolibacter sp.]